ncbi:MAG TPA: DUF883 C-terminal domain-containing protein [Blastocatellia bacterium]
MALPSGVVSLLGLAIIIQIGERDMVQTGEHTGANASFEQPRRANITFDKFKHALADKLQSAASSLETNAAEQGSHSYGWQAAELLDRSASYVRQMDPNELRNEIEAEVRSNPGRSLLIAAGAGLLIGIVLGRR